MPSPASGIQFWGISISVVIYLEATWHFIYMWLLLFVLKTFVHNWMIGWVLAWMENHELWLILSFHARMNILLDIVYSFFYWTLMLVMHWLLIHGFQPYLFFLIWQVNVSLFAKALIEKYSKPSIISMFNKYSKPSMHRGKLVF